MLDLGKGILTLLETAFGLWNDQVNTAVSILKQSPTEFKGGGPWQLVEKINPIFVALGSSLVVLFFVIGFCAESVDIREEMRLEVILRMLIRVGLAEWLVANNLTIMKTIFKSVGALVELIGIKEMEPLVIAESHKKVIRNLDFGESVIFLVIGVLLVAVALICGFFMLYTVYFRFLRIMVIAPLGALAFATTSGNRNVAHTALTYGRHVLGVILESVFMVLAMMVCNSFISSGLPGFTGNYADWAKTLIYLCEMVFSIALTVGAVKGSQQLVGKALGL
jgi:hypothetical protein